VRTSSPRPRHDRPIESVRLRISFRTGRNVAERIKELVPAASLRRNGCEIAIEGQSPSEVADKAKEMLEKVRTVVDSSESI